MCLWVVRKVGAKALKTTILSREVSPAEPCLGSRMFTHWAHLSLVVRAGRRHTARACSYRTSGFSLGRENAIAGQPLLEWHHRHGERLTRPTLGGRLAGGWGSTRDYFPGGRGSYLPVSRSRKPKCTHNVCSNKVATITILKILIIYNKVSYRLSAMRNS